MWAAAIGGISNLLGGYIGSRRGPQYDPYQPQQSNTSTYLAIAAIIIILIVIILIIRSKR